MLLDGQTVFRGMPNKRIIGKEFLRSILSFFRLDAGRGKASLVWRRTYQKLYDVDKEEKITRERFHQLTVEEKTRISRNPLTNADISTLITAAIQLHSRALEHQQDKRWWISGVVGLLGVIVGATIQALAP
jgi:hypothetical protein